MANGPAFRIAGVPVRIEPVFFAVILFLGIFRPWQFILTWAVIATASILLHELGHAVAFRVFGLHPRITLHAMGGLTSASSTPDGPRFTPVRSIVTSLAGPLSAIVLLGLPALWVAQSQGFDPWIELRPLRSASEPAEVILSQIIYINIGWSLLNLIPVLPLDGGNVTASLCELVAGRQGRRIAAAISVVVAAGLGLWGFASGFVLAPIFAVLFVGLNLRELMSAREEKADDELAEATRALLDYDPVRAERLAQSALSRRPTGERLRWAHELSAWARLASGDLYGAQHALVTMPAGSGPSASITGALALALGHTDQGVATLAWAFARDPSKSAKVLASIAAAQAGQVVPITHELLLLGDDGRAGAELLQSLLDYVGHRAEAEQVGALLRPFQPGEPHVS